MVTTKDTQIQNRPMPSSLKDEKTSIKKEKVSALSKPNVFNYIDYRQYLKDAYDHKKSINAAYSESAFILAAGFGKSSRGYFGLILKEKRNLTTKTILGFSQALKLNAKETMYFENMVHFNQAQEEEEKKFFFERMQVSSQNEKGKAFEVLESQYRYINNWHLVALRELINLKDFKEDESWIVKKMRNQISRTEAREGIQDLLNIGLIARNESGQLVSSEPMVSFNDNKYNFKSALKLHQQFNERANILLEQDPYEKRSARLTTLSCNRRDFELIRVETKQFSEMLLKKYGKSNNDSEIILQLGMQLFHLTE